MQRIGGTAICHRHAASSDNPGRTTPCKPTNLPKDCSCPAQRPRRRSNNCAFSYISCHAAAARSQQSRTGGRGVSSASSRHGLTGFKWNSRLRVVGWGGGFCVWKWLGRLRNGLDRELGSDENDRQMVEK